MDLTPEQLDAARVYHTLKSTVGAICDNFECNDEKKAIRFTIEGTPFEVAFKLCVREPEQLLTIYCKLPFVVEEACRQTYATALCRLNYDCMFSSSFDFSPDKGSTVYRVPIPFRKSLVSSELIATAIHEAYDTVTKYVADLYDLSHTVKEKLPTE